MKPMVHELGVNVIMGADTCSLAVKSSTYGDAYMLWKDPLTSVDPPSYNMFIYCHY